LWFLEYSEKKIKIVTSPCDPTADFVFPVNKIDRVNSENKKVSYSEAVTFENFTKN
jgi:hypothetical protein